ncbi:hypothetical protein EMPS_08448 [Entomortierella parvispora]|uniref:Secreted protein n=1 Tax=Entomortierella parvispora TaxID=205924 RepID=A0A9P3LZA9_9FUNG|nr:hypothetical protein EMPS_08448 [Entomortierella parvispora]
MCFFTSSPPLSLLITVFFWLATTDGRYEGVYLIYRAKEHLIATQCDNMPKSLLEPPQDEESSQCFVTTIKVQSEIARWR